ncbi:outer dynein arm-docking complex subunit 4 isoform X1 [Drosophila tropicalis]|uniref:outer dynein arm-docking complex subunit 4 isoform X1 n=1 Tax=Drosophila tropicalis TaxID=46794 RepID=UPI0035ABC502
MTSMVQNLIPQAGLGGPMPAWMKIDWSPEVEQGIYKDWGAYYSRRRRENFAMYYYDKALNLAPDDYVTYYHRSQSKRKTAQTEGALQDCKEAQRFIKTANTENAPINLEICDALYELNQFENAKAELHNNTRLFTGNKTKGFEKRLIVVDETIKESCGDALTPFFSENDKLIFHVKQLLNAQNEKDDRVLWKILKEQGKCDVISIPEIEEELLPPLEIARRKRAFDVFNQMYMDESWIDVVFLKNLRRNPNLLLNQCKYSKDYLGLLTTKQYETVKKFLKMLHARDPMYYLRYTKYSNKKMLAKFREDYLFRVQYQTRRNMISVLRSIRHLRATKNLMRLAKYVEEVMGDYVVLKTSRIMPWKFEFLNEVYNTLGLALVEQYDVPKYFRANDKKALLKLLHLPTDKSKDFKTFIFGVRSTHQEPDLVDPVVQRSRRLISRLEKRMLFAKYSIEKCYLLHQIGDSHLQSNRFDECCFSARKAIEETKNCNSNVWKFLSTMLIVKSHAALHKIERTKEALDNAYQIAGSLGNPSIIRFVEVCILCNEEEFLQKKTSLSINASRRESKVSVPSSVFVSNDNIL